MDSRFIGAFTDPARLKFLGRKVYPFCLKFRVRLEAIGSPFIEGGKISPADLLIAVMVCAEEPLGGIGWIDRLRLMRLEAEPRLFTREVERFNNYFLTAHWPHFWEKRKESRSSGNGVPWPLSVVANLMANGIPEQRAWEMPECQAIWMNVAFSIRRGAELDILTSEEEQFLQSIKDLPDQPQVIMPGLPRVQG